MVPKPSRPSDRPPARLCDECGVPYRPFADEQSCPACCFRKKDAAWREGRLRAERRADGLHRRLLRASASGDVVTIEDVYDRDLRAPGAPLHGWQRRRLERTVDCLVADGRLVESATGKLVVRRRARP
ncbi:MAG TPA: hypothetical protein VMY78_13370 [Solirubrobacteraceae bacterium]|nr:hypothetical protein [Solirubrobacteraceae bacterium]